MRTVGRVYGTVVAKPSVTAQSCDAPGDAPAETILNGQLFLCVLLQLHTGRNLQARIRGAYVVTSIAQL